MKTSKKTIAAVAVTLLLAAALFVGAGAAEDKSVATWDELKAALTAVTDGDTITLTADITVPESAQFDWTVSNPGTYTMDFDGKTITSEGMTGSTLTKNQALRILLPSGAAANPDAYKVTLKDGTLAIGGTAVDKFRVMINSYVTLTLDNMTIDGSNLIRATAGNLYGVCVPTGSVTLTGNTKILMPDATATYTPYGLWIVNDSGTTYTQTSAVDVGASAQVDGNVNVGLDPEFNEGGWSDGNPAVVKIANLNSIKGNFILMENTTKADNVGNAALDFAAGTDFDAIAAKITTAPAKAQIVMESSDSTKAPKILTFNEKYTKQDGKDPATAIKEKTTQSSGTLVTLTVENVYEFTIPSTIALATTVDGTQDAEVKLNNKTVETGKTLKVTLATAASGSSDTTYEVKNGSATSTYNMKVDNGELLKKDSVVLSKTMDTITAKTGIMTFTTLSVDTTVGTYQGQLSFNITTIPTPVAAA